MRKMTSMACGFVFALLLATGIGFAPVAAADDSASIVAYHRVDNPHAITADAAVPFAAFDHAMDYALPTSLKPRMWTPPDRVVAIMANTGSWSYHRLTVRDVSSPLHPRPGWRDAI